MTFIVIQREDKTKSPFTSEWVEHFWRGKYPSRSRWSYKKINEYLIEMDSRSYETALYRQYDKDGILLYVGISHSTIHRMGQHKRNAKWFKNVETIKVQHFSNRGEAETAEKMAILEEKPLYNVVGVPRTKKIKKSFNQLLSEKQEICQ